MKRILVILFLVFSSTINAQQFDKKLDQFKIQIVQSFKDYGEIPNKKEIDSLQFKYLYSRRLATINSKIIYYELGRMTDHGYKFLAMYNNGSLTIFRSMDFNADFIRIIEPLEKVKTKNRNVFKLFKTIKGIYDYNSNPPWGLNLELKTKKN